MKEKVVYVKTTGACNLNCRHCFTGGRYGDRTQFDPLETARWISEYIETFKEPTHLHIELHGGEPYLVPLYKLVQFAEQFHKKENVSISANSNLTFKLTDSLVNFIRVYQGSLVGTSWDYWNRWGSQRQYELWKNNLRDLKGAGVEIHLKVAVSKQLVSKSPDWFLDQMDTLTIDVVSLERLTVGGNSEHNPSIFPNNEDQDNWYLELLKRYQARKTDYRIDTLDNLVMKIETNTVKVDTNCRDCEQKLVTINSDGSLGGCPNKATDQRHATLSDPVQVFLTSEGRVTEIAKELSFSDNCLHCDVFDLCGGDCHRLPWQGNRCGGLKNTLRYLSGRSQTENIFFRG